MIHAVDLARAINGVSELQRDAFTDNVRRALDRFLHDLRKAKAEWDEIRRQQEEETCGGS